MTMDILIAGVKYCSKNEEECSEALRHLAQKRPKILLVTERSSDYGIVIRALEGRQKRGVVCRCDLDAVLSLMQHTETEMLMCNVVSVNEEGGCYTVRLSCEDHILPETQQKSIWDTWEWTGAHLLAELPGEIDTQQCFKVLRTVMRHPEMLTDEEIAEHLDLLVEVVRWDVTEETQKMMYDLRNWLVEHPSPLLRGYYDRVVHAILSQGSEKMFTLFEEEFYPMLWSSRANEDMQSSWYMMHSGSTMAEWEAVETMQEQLKVIDACLKLLPEKLYENTRHFGRLMSRLLYMHIPRKKLDMLLSAIFLRDYLEGVLEGEWNSAFEEPQDTAAPEEKVDETGEEVDEVLVDQLLPMFLGNREQVRCFLREARGLKPRELTSLVNRKLKEKLVSKASCHREMWMVLHEAKIYTCSESNWNKRVG